LNVGQSIWEKSQVLLRTSDEGTTWELEEPYENLMGTKWEQEKKQKCVGMFVGGQKIYSERKRENTKKAVTF
jgi:hypothetical protein